MTLCVSPTRCATEIDRIVYLGAIGHTDAAFSFGGSQ